MPAIDARVGTGRIGLGARDAPIVVTASESPEGLSPLACLDGDPRRAIRDDAIVCLVCGRALRQLTNTHLRAHGMGPQQYRRQFGYNARRPLMCHALHRLYSERSVRFGLAARIGARPIVVRPELRSRGGRRTLAPEELLNRADARQRRRDAVAVSRRYSAIVA